ncbi:PDZ domain-containing protein [Fredinandcohnia quinoae]|uniref:PDZ domain-containing protein n=1 Tax=Fredinandcohnia quinoae TaxID=2918902 RepID=A0AAW5E3D7_9BACI|nr:PDZ domain-containing protein [Fredinandcohnia sp. SECRCQ15]MCH1627436.1 PDZ domain-containing protein [Fredinandcohnia sp. SECRCQ15]
MVEVWLLECLKGIGRLFLHPMFYYLIGFTLLLGYFRVKRERRAFHIRVFDILHELRTLFPVGIVAGLVISIITIAAGVVIPFGSIVLVAAATFIISVTGKVRWLSPAYVMGLSFFAIILLSNLSFQHETLTRLLDDLKETGLPALAILLAMLMIVEGIFILKNGHKGTSPDLFKSKRGQQVGAHIAQRLWMVPIFLLVPGNAISTQFEWWPVFTVAGESYSLFLVPFGIGFFHRVKSALPIKTITLVGKRVILLGIIISGLSVASIWYPVISIIAVSFALVGRELISLQHRVTDDSQSFYFSKRKQGLLVLGVIPFSPAEKMAIQFGEVITKVNGIPVNTVEEFYQSIQKNSAFCKLEVLDINNEIRFVQRALYAGEHHELGILFVDTDKKWNEQAV